MARFLLAAMPFTGHVSPMIALAEALVARGHDVRFYTGSAFAGAVRASGATLVPWREAPDFDENDLAATFPRLRNRRGVRQLLRNIEDLFIGTASGQVRDLRVEWSRQPWDVLVVEDSVGGAAVSESTSAPWATVAILPLSLPSGHLPPSGMGLTPGSGRMGAMRDAALRRARSLLLRRLRRPHDAARAEVGLAPSPVTFDVATFSPHLILATGGPLMDYDRPDPPPQLHYVGVLARGGAGRAERPGWWPDLEGRAVVHVTQGTYNTDPADLIRPTLDAIADRDVLVVVATGTAGLDQLPFAVPSNARVAGFLPYTELLPRVHAMVTNGGWGGTLSALSYGIPLIVGGGDLDKPEIAARVAWTGAGVNLRTATPTAAAVRAAYDRVEHEPAIRDAAARVGEQLRSLGGAAHAAERVEGLLT